MRSNRILQGVKPAAVRARVLPDRSRLSEYFRLLEPSLRNRIATGAVWSLVGAGVASGLTMLSNIACARILGTSRFGQLGIVMATTNLFTNLFTGGLNLTATRYVAAFRDSDPDRAGRVIGLSTLTSLIVGSIIALLICLLAPWLSRDVLNAPGVSKGLMLGAAAMFFAAVNGSQTGALSGIEAFDRIALGNLIRGTCLLLLTTLGAAFGGLTGALLGYAVAGASVAVFYQIIVRRECSKRAVDIAYRFNREDLAMLWRFTVPVLLSSFLFTPAAWWSNVLLARRSGYAESGIFNAVWNWQMFILFFSTAISNIGLPILSNIREERDPAKYKRCLAINFVVVSAPAFAVAVPVVICSHFILRLYGPGFEHGAMALMLISVAAVLTGINIPVGHALWSLDATVSAMLLSLLNGATLVLASYALAGKGASGLAGAYVTMSVVQTVVNARFMIWLLRRRFAPVVSEEIVSVV